MVAFMFVLTWLKKHLHRAFHGNSQLGRQADLAAIFHPAQMPDIDLPTNQAYPLVTPIVQADIYAYQVHGLLTLEGKQTLDRLISNAGFTALPEHAASFNGLIIHPSQATSLQLHQYADFSGICVSLITNDKALLEQLIAFKSTLPHPWESFPHVDPDTLGSLQGNIDFWCNYFWRPYWLSLSASERLQYPVNWQEFSDFH
ncbi:hypothetical protein [Shewanella baltica]|uniref:hypothetical protein n=1 Tax=Shewanella baltica TaxID=62322 RepID=UPI00217E918D|nr:hypothetical protein [Shewanella baltica]MCS6179486.1 hypothetical protein [Shewanella baltica]MCS6255577.1 hypothetical protein [Shewanella baltica]